MDYLRLSGRDEQTIALVEAYAKTQGLWHDPHQADPVFTDIIKLDLSTIEPCIAGLNVHKIKSNCQIWPVAFDKFLTESKRSEEKNKAFTTECRL